MKKVGKRPNLGMLENSSRVPPTITTKGWTLEALIKSGKRMKPVPRISALQDSAAILEEIRKSETEGTPLIIEDWHKTPCWPQDNLFEADWLLENGDESECYRRSC